VRWPQFAFSRAIVETDIGSLSRVQADFTSRLVATTEREVKLDFAGPAIPVRRTSDSRSEMTELILPNDTNTLGNLLGGRLMHFIDLVGAMAAYRHARSHVVTASMDHIDFIAPVHVGDLLILKSTVNRAFRTSMEVGVKVWVENTIAGTSRHVASAYLTFVAVDSQGRSVPVPALEPETEIDKRRYEDAGRRREHRQRELERKRSAPARDLEIAGARRAAQK
jgi:acyl-CoA hydrolase